MIKPKRYHPLTMLFSLWELIRSFFLFALLLFVFNSGSDDFVMRYGRIAFLIIISVLVGRIVYDWLIQKYMIKQDTFHLYTGLIKKTERRIPFSRVHNVQRHRSFLHRLLNITSVTFETSMSGEDAAVKFEVLSLAEAEQIESQINASQKEDSVLVEHDMVDDLETKAVNTLHFQPTRKDTIKAAFTSFSFLLLVPAIASIYFQIDDVFDLDNQAESIFKTIMSSWWFIIIVTLALIIASLIFGLTRAFIMYGKYDIYSDEERIFITRGMINEVSFSIEKNKVQAIEITQSFIKRILGLAEVKLISAGSYSDLGSPIEASSLYPFLPVDKAYSMVHDILPAYQVSQQMNRLPRKSLWVRLLRPSWLLLIAVSSLFYFKPPLFYNEQAWWITSLFLFLAIIIYRLLDYINTRYTVNGQFIQLKSGSLATSLFVSKRTKIVEVKVSRSKVQQLLGLASIYVANRAKPVYHTRLLDVPDDLATYFYQWYANRVT